MTIFLDEEHFGHRYPNIDLEHFVGKDVYVRLNGVVGDVYPETRLTSNYITLGQIRSTDSGRYLFNASYVTRDGKFERGDNVYIEQINTGFTVTPTGPIVEPMDIALFDSLKELKTKLSKEQIQKLKNLL